MKGYIHNYTGEGKGKTTAALGLVIRALGAGKRVCVIQFLKNGEYSEIKALKKIAEVYPDNLYFVQAAAERELFAEITPKDRIAALKGEELFFHFLDEQAYDLYMLDELNVAIDFGLLDSQRIIRKINSLESHGEIIFTGRNASSEILEISDLVTRMKKEKHYAEKGVKARIGIEF